MTIDEVPEVQGVYIIHFRRPYRHAHHYTGFATNLNRRIRTHAAGHGARLMEVIKEAGIEWTVARIFVGYTRTDERRIKNTHKVRRYCPICRGEEDYDGR